jgi:DNA-binding transcriptional ArsR family regulator
MKDITDIQDARLVKALAHPLRVRILSVLEQRTASPSEIAEELGAPLGNVSYHVRILAGHDLIKLVRRTPRRGAIEHHYEAVGRLRISDEAWGRAPAVIKEAFLGAILGQVADFVNTAAADGGFDRPEANVTRQPLTLDKQGWLELSREISVLTERSREIQKESAKRLERDDHDGKIQTGLVLMLFEGEDFGSNSTSTDAPASSKLPRATSRRRRREPTPAASG